MPITNSDLRYLTERMIREEGATKEIAEQMILSAVEDRATNVYKVALRRFRSWIKKQERRPIPPAIPSPPTPEEPPALLPPPQPVETQWSKPMLRVRLADDTTLFVPVITPADIARWEAEYEAEKEERQAKEQREIDKTKAHAREVCSRMAARAKAEEEKEHDLCQTPGNTDTGIPGNPRIERGGTADHQQLESGRGTEHQNGIDPKLYGVRCREAGGRETVPDPLDPRRFLGQPPK